jgi:hypothetical protein
MMYFSPPRLSTLRLRTLTRDAHSGALRQALIMTAMAIECATQCLLQALNRHVDRVFSPDRKDHHCVKRKLKRDE